MAVSTGTSADEAINPPQQSDSPILRPSSQTPTAAGAVTTSVNNSGNGVVGTNSRESNRSSNILRTSSVKIPLDACADHVIFMGDLNYRIRGNNTVVRKLLQSNMHDVMVHNDQLKWSQTNALALDHFTEPPLNFRPTYKFDINSDEYDTGKKQRPPAWTDRILYVQQPGTKLFFILISASLTNTSCQFLKLSQTHYYPARTPHSDIHALSSAPFPSFRPLGITCTAYNSDQTLRTSDHRPVYASFILDIKDLDSSSLLGTLSPNGKTMTKEPTVGMLNLFMIRRLVPSQYYVHECTLTMQSIALF